MADIQIPTNEEYQNNTIHEILKRISNAQPASDGSDTRDQFENSGQSPTPPIDNTAISSIVSSLLSNSNMLSKLPSVISAIKPLMESLSGNNLSDTNKISTADATPTMNNLPIKNNELSKRGNDNRTELLRAMKPYLSRDRQNAIDYIIKLGRLGDILKSL